MTTDKEYLFLSWEDVDKDISLLAHFLKPEIEKRNISKIYCISRGGLVPSAIIARELDMHFLDTICIQSYNGNTSQKEEAEILKIPNDSGANTLIIDDLVDTGRTMSLIRRKFPQAYISTIYAKPMGKEQTDIFLKEVSQNTWIVFPWERYEGIKYPNKD